MERRHRQRPEAVSGHREKERRTRTEDVDRQVADIERRKLRRHRKMEELV